MDKQPFEPLPIIRLADLPKPDLPDTFTKPILNVRVPETFDPNNIEGYAWAHPNLQSGETERMLGQDIMKLLVPGYDPKSMEQLTVGDNDLIHGFYDIRVLEWIVNNYQRLPPKTLVWAWNKFLFTWATGMFSDCPDDPGIWIPGIDWETDKEGDKPCIIWKPINDYWYFKEEVGLRAPTA